MKKILILILFCVSTACLSAVDLGGQFYNNTKIGAVDRFKTPIINQENSLTGWINVPFSNSGLSYFGAELLFKYKYTNTNLSSGEAGIHKPLLDLTLLKFSHTMKISRTTSLILSVGRFGFSDTTRLILNQAADGFLLNFKMPKFTLTFYSGYTGLLNSLNIDMLAHKKATWARRYSMIYDFASPYLIADLGVSFPYLFKQQTLGVEFLAAIGLPGPNGNNLGLSRFYATLLLNGPIIHNLFYVLSTTFGDYNGIDISNMTKFNLTFYPNYKSSNITFNVLYASGENGPIGSFLGLTGIDATYATTNTQHSGMFKTGISASMKPVNPLLVGLGADVVVNCVENNFDYRGFQWNAQLRYQVFSDLQLALLLTNFIGKEISYDKFEASFRIYWTF